MVSEMDCGVSENRAGCFFAGTVRDCCVELQMACGVLDRADLAAPEV